MRFIIILLLLNYFPTFGQNVDTIRVYDYLQHDDRWQLRILNRTDFNLSTKNLIDNKLVRIKGVYRVSNSSIRFVSDTLKIRSKYLISTFFQKFSNIPLIIKGAQFSMEGNYFIPYNIRDNHKPIDSLSLSKRIYGSYSRGHYYGNTIIELREDTSYKIYDNSCMVRFTEEGTWKINGNLITFYPKDNKWSMLNWFTTNNQFYLSKDYLIGKKTSKTFMLKNKRPVITETFYYLSKR